MLEAQLRPEDGDLERRRVDRVADERVGERSEEHTSELQSQSNLVCRLLLEKNNLVLLTISRGRSQRRGPWLAGSLHWAVASGNLTGARGVGPHAVGNLPPSANTRSVLDSST